MNELALFAGAGGGILGGVLLGWRTVCAVEIDTYAAGILAQRQNDGCLHPFPIWDDIRTFDGRPWRGIVDVVSGGFPCQDISAAGKGAGITGSRSGLWREMARVIGEVRPRYALVENSPILTSRGLGTVLGDLAEMGYDAKWGVLGAIHAGAPHRRDRIWILAHTAQLLGDGGNNHTRISACLEPIPKFGNDCGAQVVANTRENGRANVPDCRSSDTNQERKIPGAWGGCRNLRDYAAAFPHTNSPGLPKSRGSSEAPSANDGTLATTHRGHWWAVEPQLGRVAYGVADRVDRLKCLGNGQVPAVVKLAWETLIQ